jgi:hypothetical protein
MLKLDRERPTVVIVVAFEEAPKIAVWGSGDDAVERLGAWLERDQLVAQLVRAIGRARQSKPLDDVVARRLIAAAEIPEPVQAKPVTTTPPQLREPGATVVPEGLHKGTPLWVMARDNPRWLRTAHRRGWHRYWHPFNEDIRAYVAELGWD